LLPTLGRCGKEVWAIERGAKNKVPKAG